MFIFSSEGENEGQDDKPEESEEEQEGEEVNRVEIKITSENTKPEFRMGPNNILVEFSDIAEGIVNLYNQQNIISI